MNLKLVDQLHIFILQLLGKLVLCLDKLRTWHVISFVKEYVGICWVCDISPAILSFKATEGLSLDVFLIKRSDILIIKLEPSISFCLYNWIIMSSLWCARMNHHTFQTIVGFNGGVIIFYEFWKINCLRERKLRMNLYLLAFELIINDSLQVENDCFGQLVEIRPFGNFIHLFLAYLAKIICDFFLLRILPQTIQ